MNRPVFLSALAEDELREARDWYEAQVPGLGDELLAAIDQTLMALAENPNRFQLVHEDIRRAIVR
jgi:plasmid stabilization system protein ParE